MALERSILTDEELVELLRTHYGICAAEIHRLPLGSANCYRVDARDAQYFCKEFQSGFAPSDLAAEAALVRFLGEHGLPVAPFVNTNTGEPYVMFRQRCISVTAFAAGISYGYDDLPETCLSALARMLGQLHRVLDGYPMGEDMDNGWVSAYDGAVLAAQYEKLRRLAEVRTGDPHRERMLADLAYKRDLSYRIAEYVPYMTGLTRRASHGDYQSCQCLWQGNDISAVIDFSAARVLPVVWELMRSFVQSSPLCRQTAVLDPEALAKYVGEYRSVAPLTKRDLQVMPYVYLFQLARSRYGYRQYLDGTSPDGERLLQFAFWRTEMCRQVEEKAEEIVTFLLQ